VATSVATSRSSITSISSTRLDDLDDMDALDVFDTRVTRLRAWSGITGWRFESSSAHRKAGRLAVNLDGSGDADLAKLAAREARVAVGGSGGVDVRADERLEVELDGSGDVRYHGDPALMQHIDGSGELSRAG
jgi:hypothetical protein